MNEGDILSNGASHGIAQDTRNKCLRTYVYCMLCHYQALLQSRFYWKQEKSTFLKNKNKIYLKIQIIFNWLIVYSQYYTYVYNYALLRDKRFMLC